MTLKEIRGEIDAIDAELLPLFLRRMKCAERVAAVKREQKLPVFNEKREREILDGMKNIRVLGSPVSTAAKRAPCFPTCWP